MDKDQVIKALEEVLSKNVDPSQAAIMKNVMQNFLKDVPQSDLDELEQKLKKQFKVDTIFD